MFYFYVLFHLDASSTTTLHTEAELGSESEIIVVVLLRNIICTLPVTAQKQIINTHQSIVEDPDYS